MAKPMPEAAPVTIPDFPASVICIDILFVCYLAIQNEPRGTGGVHPAVRFGRVSAAALLIRFH